MLEENESCLRRNSVTALIISLLSIPLTLILIKNFTYEPIDSGLICAEQALHLTSKYNRRFKKIISKERFKEEFYTYMINKNKKKSKNEEESCFDYE